LRWWARLIYFFVAVNALAGALILMFMPQHSTSLFFWPIKPPINGGLFGALYLGGAAAVFYAVWRNEWESSRYLVPVLVVAGLTISSVTLLHVDRFTPGVALVYWLAVYIGAPLLALAIYWTHERRGAGWQATVPVRPLTRWIATTTGVIVIVFGVALIAWPHQAIASWPWPTTPLVVRIFAAWFIAFGAGLLWFQVEKDWRRLVQIPNLMLAASTLDLIMIFVHRQDVVRTDYVLWLYCGHLVMFGLVALTMHMLQRPATQRTPPFTTTHKAV
jgi:hypothetical protein